MRLSMRPVRPCAITPTALTSHVTIQCCATVTQQPPPPSATKAPKNWESLFLQSASSGTTAAAAAPVGVINKRWMEYQGIKNWEGLLDPLDDNLRSEIIRYGNFVDAGYRAFDFDPASPSYARCRFPKSSLLARSGLPETGYVVTKNLQATSGIQLPRWIERAPSWMGTQSSWIGYVAVCDDEAEIARLGRRDVVISYRGTATCMEWLENLRVTLTQLSNAGPGSGLEGAGAEPMVESGFLSLYTSGNRTTPSLQQLLREEIGKILQIYGDEPLSLTITGHSLGAALATLTAYDIKTTFKHAPLVTVFSFGGPRVGNRSFRHRLEEQGTKILRIVNSDDVITKVPGFFVVDSEDGGGGDDNTGGGRSWIQKRVEVTSQWAYADVGCELRLSSRDSPYFSGINLAACHDLKTYLHLVSGFVSSNCPLRATARKMMMKKNKTSIF